MTRWQCSSWVRQMSLRCVRDGAMGAQDEAAMVCRRCVESKEGGSREGVRALTMKHEDMRGDLSARPSAINCAT